MGGREGGREGERQRESVCERSFIDREVDRAREEREKGGGREGGGGEERERETVCVCERERARALARPVQNAERGVILCTVVVRALK